MEGPSHPIGERWRSAVGSARSLVIYYGNPMRRWRMDRLYSDFVRRDDLVFDVGSHVGDRIGSFRRLGCRVVAVEPQPSPTWTAGRDFAIENGRNAAG
jgi:hypothetical protein